MVLEVDITFLVKNRRINQSIYKYYIWYFATKYFTSKNLYSLAFKFNILMFYLYTNLSACCSLMTGFLLISSRCIICTWTLVSTTLKLNAITTVYLNYLVIFKHFNNAIKQHCFQISYIFVCCFIVLHISSQFLVKAGYCK